MSRTVVELRLDSRASRQQCRGGQRAAGNGGLASGATSAEAPWGREMERERRERAKGREADGQCRASSLFSRRR